MIDKQLGEVSFKCNEIDLGVSFTDDKIVNEEVFACVSISA